MKNKPTVIDASIIMAALLDDNFKDLPKIKSILQTKNHLVSSSLLPLEVGNSLRYTVKSETLLSDTYQRFLNLPIKYIPFSQINLKQILKMAVHTNTSFYDSSYHYLAILLGGTFWTTDKKYYQASKKIGNILLLQ